MVKLPEISTTRTLDDLIGIAQAEAEKVQETDSGYGRPAPTLGHHSRNRDRQIASSLAPKYQIVRELHTGGQGVVYQAIDMTLEQDVAIKVLREGILSKPGERARFEREVHILKRLNHPYIVAVREAGQADGHHFFVMDYVEGVSLVEYAESMALSLAEILPLFATVCDAVHAAHLRGVIHRDLKPGNILVDDDGRPHILDFGLAKEDGQSSGDPTLTQTGLFLGSLPWTSPEQARGDHDQVDLRTDVYSLGVILYRMLTGKFPYEVHGTVGQVIERITNEAPLKPTRAMEKGGASVPARRNRIDNEVETILLKCLAKEVQRRYQSAGELAEDVRRYLNGAPILAKRDSMGYVLGKYFRKHKIKVATALAFVLVVLAAFLATLIAWQKAESAHASTSEAYELFMDSLEINYPGALYTDATMQARQIHLYLADKLNKKPLSDPREEVRIRAKIGLGLAYLDKFPLAEEVFSKALDLCEAQLDRCDPQRWITLQDFASAYCQIEDYVRAEEQMNDAISVARACLTKEHPQLETLYHERTGYLILQERVEEAWPTIESLLSSERNDGSTAASLKSFGDHLSKLSYHREAELLKRRALAIAQDSGSPEGLSHYLNSLGVTLRDLNKLEEAEALLRQSIEISCTQYPEGDPQRRSYYVSMGELGEVLGKQGEFAAAEEYILARANYLDIPLETIDWRRWKRQFLLKTIEFYEAWDEAEPGCGYDDRAFEWQVKLDAINGHNESLD